MPHYQKIMLTISVMLAALMQALDTTIANVALPHIQGSLSASADEINWVLTAYITAAAISTLPIAWLSGKFGSKKVFSLSVTGFTISSILCGMSTSIEQIVLFRLLQGVFGAALVPLSQSTLLEINPPEKAASAMALWGVGIMVGPILGPSLGGFLTDNYSWRWVFYINIPFGILSLIGILKFSEEKAKEEKAFDKIGFGLFAILIISLQLFLDRGNDQDWFDSVEINIYVIILLSVIWFLYFHLKWTKNSFISLAMFQDRNFSISLVLIFLVGIILLSTMSMLPPLLQNLLNYPITTVGVVMVPRGVGTMLTMSLVGKILEKGIDPRILITTGLLFIILSLLQMSQASLNLSSNLLVENGFIQGVGLGLVFVPLTTIAFSTLSSVYRVEATGLFTLIRNIGSSIGISIVSTLVIRYTQVNHEQIATYINKFNLIGLENGQPFSNKIELAKLLSSLSNSFDIKSLAGILNNQITQQAQFIAYLNCFKFMMFIIIATIPLVFLLKYDKKATKIDHSAIME